jgi:hypothetical protein
MFVAVVSMVKSMLNAELIAVIVEIFGCFAFEYALENYKIRSSKERILKYHTKLSGAKRMVEKQFH